MSRVSKGSISRPPPPKPKSIPPDYANQDINILRQKLHHFEERYRIAKNETEILKSKNHGLQSKLEKIEYQRAAIENSYSTIKSNENLLQELKTENTILKEKNELFQSTKNNLSQELSHLQNENASLTKQLNNALSKIQMLETNEINTSQNHKKQISKWDNKYKNLKKEYNALNDEYLDIRRKSQITGEELNIITLHHKELKDEHALLKDKFEKLEMNYNETKDKNNQLTDELEQFKNDSDMNISLKQKKNLSLIKDLKKSLKIETLKNKQLQCELNSKGDELNDLREWRNNYLLKQKVSDDREDEEDEKTVVHSNLHDNASNASSTLSSNGSSYVQVKISDKVENFLKKARRKSKSSITDLIHTMSNNTSTSENIPQSPRENNLTDEKSNTVSTKEHDEVIFALSDRLAIVKENNLTLKTLLLNKEDLIKNLELDLDKKKEWIADLIEKLNNKPLPPTPSELAAYETKQIKLSQDEERVLNNLESQGLSSPKDDDKTKKDKTMNVPKNLPPPIPIVKSIAEIKNEVELQASELNPLITKNEFHENNPFFENDDDGEGI